MFLILKLFKQLFGLRRFLIQVHIDLLGLKNDRHFTGEFRGDEPAVVPDGLRINVLIRQWILDHGVNVDAGLMGKGGVSNEGGVVGQFEIADLTDKIRSLH